MAVLPIRTYPDPVLTQACQPVGEITRGLVELAENMAETMYYADRGIGLAAPQVGYNLSLIVVDSDPTGQRGTPLFIFNPTILAAEGAETAEEGCLSLPGHFASITRAAKVVVQGQDRQGRPLTIEAQGLLARCLQHEIDHLAGKLLLDYESPLKRALYRKKRLKELKRAVDHR
jgi:peptide deformylase